MAERQEVARAIIQRFLPATGSVYLGVLAASAIAEPGGLSWLSVGIAVGSTALITAGFGTVAGLLGSALRPSIRVAKRSLLAGFAAPLAVGALSVFTQGASMATIAVLTFAAGAVTAVVSLGSGVLGRTEEEPLDPEIQAELERLDAELAVAPSLDYARLEADFGSDPLLAGNRLVSRREAEGTRQLQQEDTDNTGHTPAP